MAFVTLIAVSMCVIFFIRWYIRRQRIIKYLEKFDGPPPLPIFGNSLELLSKTEVLTKLQKYREKYGTIVKLWIGPSPSMLVVQDCKLLEFLLTSKATIKPMEYSYMKDWIGDGLLSSSGDAKWAKHRKILNAAFYVNVLEQFIPVFTSVCNVLVKTLEKEVGNPSFDISTVMKLYTLDNICECAMGTKINAIENSNSTFVKDVALVCDVLMQRLFNPLLKPDILFLLTKYYYKQKASFRRLNEQVELVILNRRAKINTVSENKGLINEVDEYGQKRRLAFLDLLLEVSVKDPSITDEHIREEVATFMFAGHDTTHAALSFCLYSLAEHQDIQEKVVKELLEVFDHDNEKSIGLKDINEMKYMEAVIKETLRFYPPVPLFGRRMKDDIEYDGAVLPKGMTITLNLHGLHKDPNIYSNPLKFDPERFLAGSAPIGSYAYLPFSAGPRDCIGKKFAMIEMKFTLASLLRKFKFLPANPKRELVLFSEVVLASATGVCIQIEKRDF